MTLYRTACTACWAWSHVEENPRLHALEASWKASHASSSLSSSSMHLRVLRESQYLAIWRLRVCVATATMSSIARQTPENLLKRGRTGFSTVSNPVLCTRYGNIKHQNTEKTIASTATNQLKLARHTSSPHSKCTIVRKGGAKRSHKQDLQCAPNGNCSLHAALARGRAGCGVRHCTDWSG